MTNDRRADWQFAALATFAAWLLYVLAFPALYAVLRDATGALCVVPVIIAAWLRGARAGVLTAIFIVPINAPLSVSEGWDVTQSIAGNALPAVLFALIASGIAYMRETNRRVKMMTSSDHTTGLPNRLAFMRELERVAALPNTAPAIVLLALAGIEDVNQSFGYDVGDEIAREIGRRLRLVPDAFAARITESTFALLTSRLVTDEAIARSALAILDAPFVAHGAVLHIEGHAAIARVGDHASGAADLLRRADAALHGAPQNGVAWAVATTDSAVGREQASRLETLAALRSAASAGELRLFYQPVMGVRDGDIRCFEALLRWQHSGELVPPAKFIGLAEQSGLIVPMTEWVLDEAIHECAQWSNAREDIFVAVNISAKSFASSAGLLRVVRDLLDKHQLPASRLGIEITESDAMADPAHTAAILAALKEIGVRSALDDFGTGYSSLGYLNQLPLDAVKIDRSFTKKLLTDASTATIIRAAIDLSHALGLDAVAEGVENAETLRRLAHMGCDRAQGYFIARPMPRDDVLPWLAKFRTRGLGDGDAAVVTPTEPAGRTILVVDDEHPLRVATHRMLAASGYNVLQAATASEALRLCSEYDGRLDLVLSDVFLTDWRGNELATHLRKSYPTLRVLLMSGDPSAARIASGTRVIQKPFTKRELVEQVKEVLAA